MRWGFAAACLGTCSLTPSCVCLVHAATWLCCLPVYVDVFHAQGMITRGHVADDLESKHRVVTSLVHSLCSRVSELRQKIAAATAAAAAGGNDAAAGSADAAAIKAAALAEMQEGSWGHSAIVKETLTMLRILASNSSSYFPEELPAQLWDALMLDPPNREDHLPATLVCLGFWCGSAALQLGGRGMTGLSTWSLATTASLHGCCACELLLSHFQHAAVARRSCRLAASPL